MHVYLMQVIFSFETGSMYRRDILLAPSYEVAIDIGTSDTPTTPVRARNMRKIDLYWCGCGTRPLDELMSGKYSAVAG